MNRHKRFWEKIAEQADLPGEAFPGESIVELFADRRILVENHRGVTEYGDERICIRLRNGMLIISGHNLSMSRMTKELLVITGRFRCVSLQGGSEK